MALKKAFEMGGGVILSNAYHRISNAGLQRPVPVDGTCYDLVAMKVDIYRDVEARNQGLSPVRSYHHSAYCNKDSSSNPEFCQFFDYSALDGTNVNLIGQSYGYLKTQSDVNGMDVNIDYTDSTDV